MKILKILFVLIVIFGFSSKIKAEDCILNGDSATEINKYNQCMAMQIDNSRRSSQMEVTFLKNELNKLRNENEILKQKLSQVKLILKNVFLDL
jgi:hypothetical protein